MSNLNKFQTDLVWVKISPASRGKFRDLKAGNGKGDDLEKVESEALWEQCYITFSNFNNFHFQSFFGRATEEAKVAISECKTGGNCSIKGRSRTSCKSCRLRKCRVVGMSRQSERSPPITEPWRLQSNLSGSRYGRRSTYFKVQCLLDAQQEQQRRISSNQRQSWLKTPTFDFSPPRFQNLFFLELESKRRVVDRGFYSQRLPGVEWMASLPHPGVPYPAPSQLSDGSVVHKPVPVVPTLLNAPVTLWKDHIEQSYGRIPWPYANGLRSPVSPTLPESKERQTPEQTEPLDLTMGRSNNEPLDLRKKKV